MIRSSSKPRHNAAVWRKSHSGGPGGVVSNQLLEDAAETHATMTALGDLGQDGRRPEMGGSVLLVFLPEGSLLVMRKT